MSSQNVADAVDPCKLINPCDQGYPDRFGYVPRSIFSVHDFLLGFLVLIVVRKTRFKKLRTTNRCGGPGNYDDDEG